MRDMTSIGYALSSEEHTPADLLKHAALAEQHGFGFALISDHFHPWIDKQGQSPFVWGVLGAIARTTDRLVIGTGVTCPTMRIHPAIIAQAAATAACLLPERFFLGVGTGERLNEHVLGQAWPDWEMRAAMLEEAVSIIRELWTGELTTHHGAHFTVESARIYTLPSTLPPIHVAGSGERMAALAGRIGDGFIGTGPDEALIGAYRGAGGSGPRFGQVTLCWGESEAKARRTARAWWPTVAIHGNATQELALPKDFEELTRIVDEDDVAAVIPCGPEAQPILDSVAQYVDAGYDHVYLHQVGPDQEGFLEFASRSLLPEFDREPAAAASSSR
jgi:coenzyme F420-dependent glucose-6-phosphate dehydrogenase